MKHVTTTRRYAPRDQPELQAALDRIAALEAQLEPDPGIDLDRVDPHAVDASLRAHGYNLHGDLFEQVQALQVHYAQLDPPEGFGQCESCGGIAPLSVEACPFCGSPGGAPAAAPEPPPDAAPDEGDALGVGALADAIRASVRAELVDAVAGAAAIRALVGSRAPHDVHAHTDQPAWIEIEQRDDSRERLPPDPDAWQAGHQEHDTMGHDSDAGVNR